MVKKSKTPHRSESKNISKIEFFEMSSEKRKKLKSKKASNKNLETHTSQFIDRDHSWLNFNFRVLNEAIDPRTPLLERLKFNDIFRSNNDEFFMKRIGALTKKIQSNDPKILPDRHAFEELHLSIRKKCCEQIELFSRNFQKFLVPKLEQTGIKILTWSQLSTTEQNQLFHHFKENLFPILTPLAVDKGHPFPFLSNLSKSIGVGLRKPQQKERHFARVKIPSEIPQWFCLKETKEFEYRFINIDEIISANISSLFPGMSIDGQSLFRVTRNAAIDEEGDDAEDKMEWVEEGLKERKFAPIVRLELALDYDPWVSDFLIEELNLTAEQVYIMPTLASYTSLSMIYEVNRPKLKYKKYTPNPFVGFDNPKDSELSIFNNIRKKDHLVHFPYESFNSTVQAFVRQAAEDPKVMGIKIILYRTDTDGNLVNALIRAAENKKQVACIIELTARFDEERNIQWAQKLEEAGVHVSYGLMEYKTHAKMIVVVRQDPDGIRTYVNIGTGNYNSQTSKVYTDFSLFTCKKEISAEVLEVFNFLTGRSLKQQYNKLLVAPFNMFKRFKKLIHEETELALKGQKGRIIAKMNQLKEPQIIETLYKASQAGVKITLIVRGFCSLRPGVKALSENIEVFSIVGRLLEHSRIYYFGKGQTNPLNGHFYLGSADWMSRNLHDRVEIISAIEEEQHKNKLWDYLNLSISDNRHLWELKSDGHYIQRQPPNKPKEINSQLILMKQQNHKKK